MPAETADQVDVLHERKWHDTADAVQRVAVDQQPLIAIWQGENAATPADQAFQSAGPRVGAVQGEPEIRGLVRVVAHVRRGLLTPFWCETRVGMQKQQPLTRRRRDPAANCCPLPLAARHNLGSGIPRDFGRAVLAAAIRDDDLVHGAERGQGRGQGGGGVQGGDDGGYFHVLFLTVSRRFAMVCP